MKKLKKILKIAGIVLGAILLPVIGYLIYVFASYHRLPDNVDLTIDPAKESLAADSVTTGAEYSIISYNVGFGAYTPDFSFFMDGGTSSWGASKESVTDSIQGAAAFAHKLNPDFVMFQEIDVDSTRSYHVNQYELISNELAEYTSAYALDYDSPFLMYPFNQPHGKSVAGIALYSRYPITSSLRRSLPIANDFNKLLDLDRCYSISRIPVNNGKELIIITLHLSAYGNSDAIREGQVGMLLADMEAEYAKGNYVIVGGDFNHDLLADENGVGTQSWAFPFPRSKFSEHFEFALDRLPESERASLWHTSRNADIPYDPEKSYTVVLDGFIISDNVQMNFYTNINTGYLYSDHDPVHMGFTLLEQ